MTDAEKAAALAKAKGIVTPYSQIKDSQFITPDDEGQFDLTVTKLELVIADNGMYAVEGEFTVVAPAEGFLPYRRTLYIGSRKDPLAELPETRLNSPSLRFLRNIAKANSVPTNDVKDEVLCASLLGKGFGVVIKRQDNNPRFTEFGRNVTPLGTIPARLFRNTTATPATTTAGANGGVPREAFGTE